MKHSEAILNELSLISPALAAIPKVNVFKVPPGYFESFPAICISLVPVQPAVQTPMQVPAGYFESLAENIMAKIRAEENERSALIKIDHPFKVPEHYFEQLPATILKKVTPARVVKMNTGFFKYAIAAVLTGLLGLTLFTQVNKNGTDTGFDKAVFAQANNILKNNSFDKTLESIEDDDILQYLSSSGQDVEAALVASYTDENNLPSADEYLFDENTLDQFLSEKNIRNYNN